MLYYTIMDTKTTQSIIDNNTRDFTSGWICNESLYMVEKVKGR